MVEFIFSIPLIMQFLYPLRVAEPLHKYTQLTKVAMQICNLITSSYFRSILMHLPCSQDEETRALRPLAHFTVNFKITKLNLITLYSLSLTKADTGSEFVKLR